MSLPFRDRHDAGRQLAEVLCGPVSSPAVVLGIPRGGVPVAYEIAHALRAPLDIFMLRHLHVPGSADRSFGVVASGGVRVVDEATIDAEHIPATVVDAITHRERLALLARERTYRGHQVVLDVRGRVAILVDDGMSTAGVLREHALALREHQPAGLIIAVPLMPAGSRGLLDDVADDVACIFAPPPPSDVARWHHEFLPISHTEVRALLALAQAEAQSRELAASG
jgi:putative phosphoribosyl transferase